MGSFKLFLFIFAFVSGAIRLVGHKRLSQILPTPIISMLVVNTQKNAYVFILIIIIRR